ncbi:MAG: 2-C-methyl-D-erythritol 4-phosphate cytidylyltransferase [Wenzhouxiangellaceae bacterium]
MKTWAVIPAAGDSKRMPGDLPKQYRLIAGEPVILHTLRLLQRHPDIHGFMIGLAPDDTCWSAVPQRIDKPLLTCEGGNSRVKTVLHCLDALHHMGEDDALVLVHDAVRPCLEAKDLDKVLAMGAMGDHGAVLAQPLNDPVKRCGESGGDICESHQPEGLWLAQTPQVFKLGLLRAALRAAIEANEVLDPSSAMERSGYRPRLVVSSPSNFKITYESDLALAARLVICDA